MDYDKYDPKDYWEVRGNAYKGVEHWDEMVVLRSLVHRYCKMPSKILEVGSGYGRICELLKHESIEFHACDIADSMRYIHCERTALLPDKWDGVTLPYKDDDFKLVIAYDLLLHVPTDSIRRMLSEVHRVSSRLVCIASWVIPEGCPRAHHVFAHDYARLFVDEGFIVKDEAEFGERNIWMLQKR